MLIVLVGLALGVIVMLCPSDGSDPKSTDMKERLAAVDQLVGSTEPEALETLGELAGDSEVRVAKAAIRAIGSRSDEASRLKLKQVVEENKNGVLCGTAAAELGNFKKTDYRLLTGILLKDKRPGARAGAARGLARLHSFSAKEDIIKALSDPDAETRRNAFEALGAITATLFKFDAAAPPETQVQNIAEIKRAIARTRYVHSRGDGGH